MSTHALASITATYTDSEPEGDENNLDPEESKTTESENEESQRSEEVKESALQNGAVTNQEVSAQSAKLVSYHDDTVISDDELDTLHHRANDVGDLNIFTDDGDVQLPPEPTGPCSPRLLEKVKQLHDKVSNGFDINEYIQNRKEFRNPSIYEKLIQFCGINELGTNYSPDVYDPFKWSKESYYEELAKVQKTEMDRREKEKKERTKVEIVSGTKKSSGEEEQKKRKSKWDQVGSAPAGTAGISVGLIRPAGLLQATLTTTVTGTKGTLIPAFGSLPKKPRL